MTMSPVEDKRAKGCGGQALRMVTQGLEQLKKREAVVMQRGFRGAAVGTHPTAKCHEEIRGGRCRFERSGRGDAVSRFEKGDQMTGAPQQLNGISARRLQAVIGREVDLKSLQ